MFIPTEKAPFSPRWELQGFVKECARTALLPQSRSHSPLPSSTATAFPGTASAVPQRNAGKAGAPRVSTISVVKGRRVSGVKTDFTNAADTVNTSADPHKERGRKEQDSAPGGMVAEAPVNTTLPTHRFNHISAFPQLLTTCLLIIQTTSLQLYLHFNTFHINIVQYFNLFISLPRPLGLPPLASGRPLPPHTSSMGFCPAVCIHLPLSCLINNFFFNCWFCSDFAVLL